MFETPAIRSEKLLDTLSFEKAARQMCMKLTLGVNLINICLPAKMLWRSTSISPTILCPTLPGVNFINVLRTAFALVDPKSVKNTVKSSVSLYAFGIYERKSCT